MRYSEDRALFGESPDYSGRCARGVASTRNAGKAAFTKKKHFYEDGTDGLYESKTAFTEKRTAKLSRRIRSAQKTSEKLENGMISERLCIISEI